MTAEKTGPAGDQETHFGYRRVATEDKAGLVAGVFDSVATRYDVMNDLMSLGMHRVLKRIAVELTAVNPGANVLDLAAGTGDLARLFAPVVGTNGLVVMCDINEAMLSIGRDRLIDRGLYDGIEYVIADGEALPFAPESFDCVTVGFGLRNFTHMDQALATIGEVLRPGGCLLVLEFSTPVKPLLGKAYDLYSQLWPRVGKLVTGDADSYRYLVESIRMHPDQTTLEAMLVEAGFERVRYHNFLGGIVAMHLGYRP